MDRLDYVARTIQKAIDGKNWRPDGQDDNQVPHLRVVRDMQAPEDGPECGPGALAEDAEWPGGTPAGAAGAGCTPHNNCGPSLGEVKKGCDPQAIPEFGRSPGGLGDEGSFEGPFNQPRRKEGDVISPGISSSPESSGSAKTPEASVAAMVREIALATNGEFTVDEITRSVVKALSISPSPSTPDEWKLWNKRVSNELGRLAREGLLVRVKKGVFRRADDLQETQRPQDKYETRQERFKSAEARRQAVREACRMDFSKATGEPFHLLWPLQLGNWVNIYPRNEVVVGGAPDAGKTAFVLNPALLNMDRHQVNYINSEMGDDEFIGRLQSFEEAHGLPPGTMAEKVDFYECTCNIHNKEEMDKLKALIDPDGIIIIDYLEIEKDFYEIAGALREIHSQLNRGLAIVCVQKASRVSHLRGGDFALQLPRVAIALDYHAKSGLCRLKFLKAKFPARKGLKPKRATIWYEVVDGAKFILRLAPPADHKQAPKAPSSEGEKKAKGKKKAVSSE
jgi:hypothetical protein